MQNFLYPAGRLVRSSSVLDVETNAILFWPLLTFTFIWGLIWGSFFNVCIYRIPAGKSIVSPGSHCYTCGSPVLWFDNIPLISYLLLQGNCRFCGTHFSPRYFFVELLTGILFASVFVVFGIQWQTPFHLVFVSLLIIGTFTDIDHFIIPDGITLGGTAFAVAATGLLGPWSFIAHEFEISWELAKQFSFQFSAPSAPHPLPYYYPFLFSLFGAAFGYALLWAVGAMGKFLFRKEAMGMGDVKLFAFLGAWMGPLNCLWILFLSAFVGAFLGLSLLIAHKLVGRDEFDDLTLAEIPTAKSRWLIAESQLSNDADAVAVFEQNTNNRTEESNATDALSIKYARRTSRQLHHFPYGPYIALAAIIVLLFHDYIEHWVQVIFLLG